LSDRRRDFAVVVTAFEGSDTAAQTKSNRPALLRIGCLPCPSARFESKRLNQTGTQLMFIPIPGTPTTIPGL